MRFINIYKGFFVILLCLFVLFSCGKNNSQNINNNFKKIDPRGVLYLNLGAEPTILNPILSIDSASSGVIDLVFSGLMKVDEKLEMVPDLAESYKISQDGKEYVFKLKSNVLWHDGHKFSAEDVIFTFEKILDPTTNTVRRSSYLIDGKPIKFIKIDDLTVKVVLPKPRAPFLVNMGMGILPKHLLEKENINTSAFNRAPIGTGPFKFAVWKSGEYIRVIRNDDYFVKKPLLSEIVLKIIPDKNTALLALEKGEIDASGIPAKDFYKFKARAKNIDIYRYYSLNYTYMGYNLEGQYFKDLRLRQAIALAINKEVLVKAVLKDFGYAAHLPASPVSWAYPAEKEIIKYKYNSKEAKKLLEESGFTFNAKTKFMEKNGRPFEFTLITNKGNKEREKTAEIIQQYLSQVGVKMNIQLLEWSAFIKILNHPRTPKKFDAVLLGWSLSIDPDMYDLWHSSEYPKGFNLGGYIDKRVDKLLEDGRTEISREKRKEIYKELYLRIANDQPYYFLYYPESVVGINKRVKGLSRPGPAGVMMNIENIWVESN